MAPVDGRIGTEIMPGVFAQIGMEYGHKYGGTSFELFAKISEIHENYRGAGIFPVIPEAALRATLGILARNVE